MSDDTFKRKIEPICHIIANVYAIAGASYLLAGQHFNSVGHRCWINAVPPNCINDPEVECIRGDEMAHKYRWWFLGYSIYAVFAIITINMLLIIWTVFVQKRKRDQWRFGSSASDSDNGGRCFPCIRSIFSILGISAAEKETRGTNCALIEENDEENPHYHHLVPLEDCLQPVKSPKVSASLTTRAGTSQKSPEQLSSKSFKIYGAEDEDDEGCEGSALFSSVRSLGSAAASRAGTADDPYAFDLKKVKAKLQEESPSSITGMHTNHKVTPLILGRGLRRRSSITRGQTNRKVASAGDMAPLKLDRGLRRRSSLTSSTHTNLKVASRRSSMTGMQSSMTDMQPNQKVASRRSSITGMQPNQKVASPVDMTPLNLNRFDLKTMRAKQQEESRRSLMTGMQTNRKVASPVDVAPLPAMTAGPNPGKLHPPLTDRARVVGAEGKVQSISEEIEPSTRITRKRTVGPRCERKEVVIQGSLYIGAFFIAWIWPVVNQ